MPLTTNQPFDDLIFHYTTFEGLLGIFDSWTLWATDVKYLNDFNEFAHENDFLDRGEDRALELIATDPGETGPNSLHEASRHVRGMAFMMRSEATVEVQGGPFVTSFCESGDLLSQWRGYGNAGVSLGFSREALATLPPLPNPTLAQRDIDRGATWVGGPDMGEDFRPRLIKVEYGDPTTEQIEEYAQALAGAARLLASGDLDNTNLRGTVEAGVMTRVAGFKDSAFEAEAEYRLVVHGAWASFALDHFRAGPLGLVPYIEIPLDLRACLRWIIIGPPRLLNDGREQAVLRLLNHHHLDTTQPVFVSNSMVPFR